MRSVYLQVWIVLCVETQADRVTGALVRAGHQVGPLAASKVLTFSGHPYSSVLALRVDTGWKDEKPPSGYLRFMPELKALLEKLGASYHAIIIQEDGAVGNQTTWSGGTIFSPPPAKTAHERITED